MPVSCNPSIPAEQNIMHYYKFIHFIASWCDVVDSNDVCHLISSHSVVAVCLYFLLMYIYLVICFCFFLMYIYLVILYIIWLSWFSNFMVLGLFPWSMGTSKMAKYPLRVWHSYRTHFYLINPGWLIVQQKCTSDGKMA